MIKETHTTYGTTKAYCNGVLVEYKRNMNDFNGNPVYKVSPVNFIFRKSDKVFRNYKPNYSHGGYYLIKTFNIETAIENLCNEMAEKIPFPSFDLTLLSGYWDVKTLNDYQKEAQ